MNLGQRVRELRTTRGMTLPQLAEGAGISKGYVWKIEQSGVTPAVRVRPSHDTLTKLAAALGVSLGDLVDEGTAAETEAAGLFVLDGGLEFPEGFAKYLDTVFEPPESLVRYSRMKKECGEALSEEEIWMLSSISHKGRWPENNRDWDYIFESIRRVLEVKSS